MHPEDAQDAFELNTDPDVLRYTGDVPFASVEEARTFLANYDAYTKWGYGRMNCYLRETGEYIGWCGLKYHPDEQETDLGYRLKKKFWNQGFATEASRLCLQYGFEELQLPFIVARIMKENLASISVAEIAGMRYWKDDTFHGEPGVSYRITREDYFSLPPTH